MHYTLTCLGISYMILPNYPFYAFFPTQGTAVAQLMRTPSLILDDRLRREVEDCMSEDKDYSPYLDRVRRGLGAEYEFILQQKLRARCA